MWKILSAFLIPGGLVFCAAVGFLRPHGLPAWLQQPISALPYIVLGFGLVFGWYFGSTRMILSLLMLSLADRALAMQPFESQDPASIGGILFATTAFLLPLNLLALSLLNDEKMTLFRGVLRLLFLLPQPFVVLRLCHPEQRELAGMFQQALLPVIHTDWTVIPQPALIAFAIAGIMHLSRFMLHRDPLEGGSIWALAAIFVAYQGGQYGWQATNFFSTAGLILFLTLIQSSYQRTYRDELTGIPGHLAYEEAVGQLGKRFTIAVLAVDQLKSYANTHGKSVSEQVFKAIALKVHAACQGGRVFRVSGEELTLLFPGQSATDTIIALEAVRKGVEQTSLFLRGRDRVWEDVRGTKTSGRKDRELPVTVSIGIAEKVDDDITVSLVIKSAFRALYEAKGAGGNVVKRGLVAPEPVKRSYGSSGRIIASGEY
jgi:diguanylate cyclase (GGDEF)-like protein